MLSNDSSSTVIVDKDLYFDFAVVAKCKKKKKKHVHTEVLLKNLTQRARGGERPREPNPTPARPTRPDRTPDEPSASISHLVRQLHEIRLLGVGRTLDVAVDELLGHAQTGSLRQHLGELNVGHGVGAATLFHGGDDQLAVLAVNLGALRLSRLLWAGDSTHTQPAPAPRWEKSG